MKLKSKDKYASLKLYGQEFTPYGKRKKLFKALPCLATKAFMVNQWALFM